MTEHSEISALLKLAGRVMDDIFDQIAEIVDRDPDARWHAQLAGTEPYGPRPPHNGATLYDPRLETLGSFGATHIDIEPPTTYAIPGAPPTDRKVTNEVRTWQRHKDGLWFDLDDPGARGWEWVELLQDHGPVRLVPLTVQEHADAVLYGPPGARWGDPDTPCPYYTTVDNLTGGQPQGVCALGVGHISVHRDSTGQALGQTTAPPDDAPTAAVGVTPHEASRRPCTCGDPARHRQGCARYPFGPRTLNNRGIR